MSETVKQPQAGLDEAAARTSLTPLDDAERRRRMRKVIGAAGAGHFVEWFDFGLYGTLATVISVQFFQQGNTQAALLSAFAVFGAGFVMRPLGGLFWGSIGDRLGRKTTLATVILVTSGATVVMGLLPTFDMVGLWAPFLLVIVRLVQGFAAGGESSGATTLLAEYGEGREKGGLRVALLKELHADDGGESAVEAEVEPFDEVPSARGADDLAHAPAAFRVV